MKTTKRRDRRARIDVIVTTIVVTAKSAVLALPGTAGASRGIAKHHVTAAASGRVAVAPLAGSVPGPLTVEHDQFVDADGRLVFLHGLFGVWKIPGGFPQTTTTLTDSHRLTQTLYQGWDLTGSGLPGFGRTSNPSTRSTTPGIDSARWA